MTDDGWQQSSKKFGTPQERDAAMAEEEDGGHYVCRPIVLSDSGGTYHGDDQLPTSNETLYGYEVSEAPVRESEAEMRPISKLLLQIKRLPIAPDGFTDEDEDE